MNDARPTVSGSGQSGIAPLTTSITVPPNTGLLLVKVAAMGDIAPAPAISTVAFGGAGLTHIPGCDVAVGSQARCEIWYLENPTPGTANLVTTPGSSITGDMFHMWECWPASTYTAGSVTGSPQTNSRGTSSAADFTVGTAPAANQVITGVVCTPAGAAQSIKFSASSGAIEIAKVIGFTEPTAAASADSINSALTWNPGASFPFICGASVKLSMLAPAASLDYSNAPPVGDSPAAARPSMGASQ